MPELPEVEAVRRMLERKMRGSRIVRVQLHRPDLRRPFPPDFAPRLTGQRIQSVGRRGKYLLAALGSGDTLLIHLGMSGSFDAARPPSRVGPHDHVVIDLSSGIVITFNDPRRFGLMDLIRVDEAGQHPLHALGPEPLDPSFDAAALARACAGKRVSLKVALLDQRVVAGVGNIYASEALHLAGLSPRRRAQTLATPSGAPREPAFRLTKAIKAVLRSAVERQVSGRDSRFRVYEREGERCLKRGCTGTIRRLTQAGRSTYYCPVCQR